MGFLFLSKSGVYFVILYFFILHSFTFFWFFCNRYKKCILVSIWLYIFLNLSPGEFRGLLGFAYDYCLIHQSALFFCWVFLRKSAAQLYVFANFSAAQFYVFVNVLQVFSMYLNLRVYLFIFVFVVGVLLSIFTVFVNFSNVHSFSVKIKVSDWVRRNFFSLAVFGGNLLAGDVHSSMALDIHVQAWQWIGSICLLTWGLRS